MQTHGSHAKLHKIYAQQRAHHLVGKIKFQKILNFETYGTISEPTNNAHNFLHIGPQKLAQKPLENPNFPLQIGSGAGFWGSMLRNLYQIHFHIHIFWIHFPD